MRSKTIKWDTKTGEVSNFDQILNALEEGKKGYLKRAAYYIRCSDDYQFVVDYYRGRAIEFDGCVGGMVALENLKHLPLLMRGYKEKFILQTF